MASGNSKQLAAPVLACMISATGTMLALKWTSDVAAHSVQVGRHAQGKGRLHDPGERVAFVLKM